MEEKLKLVRALIPWSLVVRGAVFGVAWFFLPFLFFVAVATFLFLQPPFQAWRFFPVFFLIIFLAYMIPASFWAGLLLSILFLTTLGIKNLLLVDRELSAEVFLFIISFLLWFLLFTTQARGDFAFFLLALSVIGAHLLLLRFLFKVSQTTVLATGFSFLLMLFGLLSLQLVWVTSLLPLSAIFAALFLGLFSGVFWEFLLVYYLHLWNPQKTKIIISGIVFLVGIFISPALSFLM